MPDSIRYRTRPRQPLPSYHPSTERTRYRPADTPRPTSHPTSLPAPTLSLTRYRPAHTPAYVPSDFDPALVPRSATLPPVQLERFHVYGYNGLGTLNKVRRRTPNPGPDPDLSPWPDYGPSLYPGPWPPTLP